MRLPQDRILHIETKKFENGKVMICAEWQGELVRCKHCKYYEGHEVGWCPKLEKGIFEDFFCALGEPYKGGGDHD